MTVVDEVLIRCHDDPDLLFQSLFLWMTVVDRA